MLNVYSTNWDIFVLEALCPLASHHTKVWWVKCGKSVCVCVTQRTGRNSREAARPKAFSVLKEGGGGSFQWWPGVGGS
jgi:hypothetical protein